MVETMGRRGEPAMRAAGDEEEEEEDEQEEAGSSSRGAGAIESRLVQQSEDG